MRVWTNILTDAAKSEVAHGRCDAAAERLQCLVRMAGHLQQQFLAWDFYMSLAIEGNAWITLAECTMEAEDAEELLKAAEAIPPEALVDDYERVSSQVMQGNRLIRESIRAEWTVRQRMEDWWRWIREKDEEEICRVLYPVLLCHRRGVRLVAGLRRYHDANGRWPDSLEEIRTLVPEQALIDPYTEQRFMYRTEAGEFLLYSKGPNRRDDNGEHHSKADDYYIWPPRGITSP